MTLQTLTIHMFVILILAGSAIGYLIARWESGESYKTMSRELVKAQREVIERFEEQNFKRELRIELELQKITPDLGKGQGLEMCNISV